MQNITIFELEPCGREVVVPLCVRSLPLRKKVQYTGAWPRDESFGCKITMWGTEGEGVFWGRSGSRRKSGKGSGNYDHS